MNGIVICSHPACLPQLENVCRSMHGYKDNPVYIVMNEMAGANKYPAQIREDQFLRTTGKWLGTELKLILGTRNYELGALWDVYVQTTLDKIFFMQDTCEVGNVNTFAHQLDIFFKLDSSVRLSSFLGVYRRPVLDLMKFPVIKTKVDAIMSETEWDEEYFSKDPNLTFTPVDALPKLSDKFEKKFGRHNMVVQNSYMKKFKTTSAWKGVNVH